MVILLILNNKINRAIVAISGAVVTYYTLVFLDGMDFSVIVGLLFGTAEDDFVNLHSLILIIGMMLVIQIAEEAGVFQFLAAFVIKRSNGDPIKLMILFCVLAVACSAILNSLVTVMMLIPLTIMVSRILDANPTPYILSEGVIVNLGSTVFPISSISNILITTSANISFPEFLFNIGFFSIIVVFLTIPLFIFLFKPKLTYPDKQLVEILAEFDIWNVVRSKKLFFTSFSSIIALILAFFLIPSTLIGPDMIALTIAIVMIFLARIQGVDDNIILKKVDYQLLLYLIGIFMVAGGLEITGVITVIGDILNNIGGHLDPLIQILFIMWCSAFLSSFIDNIPITKVLIPIVHDFIPPSLSTLSAKNYYYGLSFGANWGDNLAPLGDNILVLNIAEQNKRPINIIEFWKIGFITSIYQLTLASIYFILIFDFISGLLIIFIFCIILLVFFTILLRTNTLIGFKNKFRNLIVG